MTPGLVASVWIGNDGAGSLPSSMELSTGFRDTVTSSRQPIYVWNDFVADALHGRSGDPNGFPVPDGITFRNIDLKTGAVTPGGVRAAFRSSDVMFEDGFGSAIRIQIPLDSRTGKRADTGTPPEFVQIIEVDPSEVPNYL